MQLHNNFTGTCTCIFSADTDEQVGFTAQANTDAIYNASDVVKFGATLSNFGECYNTNTSIFICPYDGIYMFNHIVQADNDADVRTLIKIGNREIGRTYSHETLEKSSAFAIVECESGEKAWVESLSDNQAIRDGVKQSTFSGYLLHRY